MFIWSPKPCCVTQIFDRTETILFVKIFLEVAQNSLRILGVFHIWLNTISNWRQAHWQWRGLIREKTPRKRYSKSPCSVGCNTVHFCCKFSNFSLYYVMLILVMLISNFSKIRISKVRIRSKSGYWISSELHDKCWRYGRVAGHSCCSSWVCVSHALSHT